MPLVDILTEFRNTIINSQSNLDIAFSTDAQGNYIYQEHQRNFIVESVYLKIYITWEAFLEKSYAAFLSGELPINGNAITKYATPLDLNHAQKMIIGAQRFFDWADTDKIIKIGEIYFDTTCHVVTIIKSIKGDLNDMRTIRNSAAHMSSSTSAALDALATRKLRRQCSNYSVTQLITSFDPLANVNNQMLLVTYTTLLDVAAERICNG